MQMLPYVLTPLVMASKSSLEKFYPGTFVGNFLMYARYGSKKYPQKFGNFCFCKKSPDSERKFGNF